ncbi:MAG: hypothetical protein WA417_25915 [Stellaceae bacterium]
MAIVIVLPGAWPEDAKGARQLAAWAPDPIPAQVQDQGPLPDTLEAVPAEHRLLDGAETTPTALALPHEPLATSWAEHSAVAPPLAPVQSQDQGPLPETPEAVPAEHRLLDGVEATSAPLALPQEPLTAVLWSWAEHRAVTPPLAPAHSQDQGPLPETPEALPAEHRLLDGAEATSVPLALPQEPLTAALLTGAEHCAVVPRLEPVQSQVHGPVPEILDAVPAEHKLLVGFDVTATSSALPQAPFTGRRCASAIVLPPISTPKPVGEYAGSIATATKSTAKT